MVPLQSVLGEVVGYLVLLAFLLLPGIVAAVLWAPFLASTRVRSLFRSLPPAESPYLTYPLVGVAASLPYVLGVTGALAVTDASGPQAGGAMANTILDVVVPVSLGYVLLGPPAAVLGLPRAGVDWDPTGYGPSTWVLLVAGAVWYVLLFAVPLLFVSFFLALPT
ncbi:hypothetical protein [Halorarius halobius]|uniref:hypothetical protein n=1 Tax=Halorarius halobius TaxID=2962671 RepID=UPI0020CE3AB8|nr:hypothetical protein [Halorarius halobius]